MGTMRQDCRAVPPTLLVLGFDLLVNLDISRWRNERSNADNFPLQVTIVNTVVPNLKPFYPKNVDADSGISASPLCAAFLLVQRCPVRHLGLIACYQEDDGADTQTAESVYCGKFVVV